MSWIINKVNPRFGSLHGNSPLFSNVVRHSPNTPENSLSDSEKIIFELKIRKVIDDWRLDYWREGMSVIEFEYFCEMEIRFFQLASLILRGVQSADKVQQVTMKNVSISTLKIQLFQSVHESQQQYLIIKCHTHFSFEQWKLLPSHFTGTTHKNWLKEVRLSLFGKEREIFFEESFLMVKVLKI